MSAARKTVRHVAVIDLWTDTNRGDNALQLSLIRQLRDRYPGATITGVFRFGTNELDDARPEIASTAAALDEVVGGLRRTRYAEPNTGARNGTTHKLGSLLSFVEALLAVVAFRLLPTIAARKLVGIERHRSLSVMRDADVVVWKGKNFRDYSGFTAISRALTLCGAGGFAGMVRHRVDCVNASFWPIQNPVQRALFRWGFRRCATVTVRDRSSLSIVRELLPHLEVHHAPDLSLTLLTAPDVLAALDRPARRTHDVALTVTAWGSGDEQRGYVNAVVAATERLQALGARTVLVVPQVTRAAEDNSDLLHHLVTRLLDTGMEVETLAGSRSIEQLLNDYASCRVLLGARMHSCVFARAVRTPFVALAYDNGPKWEVLSRFWPDDLVLDYRSCPGAVSLAAERVWIEGDRLVADSESDWLDAVAGAADNVAWVDVAR